MRIKTIKFGFTMRHSIAWLYVIVQHHNTIISYCLEIVRFLAICMIQIFVDLLYLF